MKLIRWARRRPYVAAATAMLHITVFVLVIVWFEPHRLFIDQRVAEAMPGASVTLASGSFRSLEHRTSGKARLLRLSDGRRVLRLEDLHTSNGPELRVYLSPVAAKDDWFAYDDVPFIDLGDLKGNIGSSNYELPLEVDDSKYASAVVWCRRFSVGFGVAPLDRSATMPPP